MPSSKDIDYNPVVWVSLASVSGLSLVSLGQPGLRTDLDEQVYTGGLTAVQAMLGGEVGGDTDRFVGGSHSNRTGRFRMKNDTGGELVGQYLLISPDNIKVADDLVDHYEHLVSIFAESTLKTEVYERIEREFRALGVNDVLELFLESITKARKKKSIRLNEKLFFEALKNSINKSINDYEYSPTLVKISEYKGKYRDLSLQLNSEKEQLLNELSNDVMELLTSDHPHALVMFPKINSLRKDLFKHIKNEIKDVNAEAGLEEIITDFEKNELTKFLDDFALHEVNKANLHVRLENEIFNKFKREFPLLFLIDPEITNFKEAINKLTAEINEQYDLGGTLSRIGKDMLKGRDKEEELFIPYIRHFCDQFSTGLTASAWKYMQVLFKIIGQGTKVEIEKILPSMKDQIPESHFLNVQKMITKFKLTKIDPLSFSVRQASDILPFYRGLFSSLAYGFDTVIENIVFSEKNPDNYLRVTVRNFKEFCSSIHPIFGLVSIYSYMEKNSSKLDFALAYPLEEDFGKDFNIVDMTSQSILEAFKKANINSIEKEQQLVDRRLDEFHKAFEKRINDLNKFHSRNTLDISKGYSLQLKETKILSFSSKPAPGIQEILQKMSNEYEKILEQTKSELDDIKEKTKKFIDGNIAEKDLKKKLADTGYLSKAQNNFEKVFQKMKGSISKKYSDISGGIEKRFGGFTKDFAKEFSQASKFLNINQKAISKGETDFLPSSSHVRDNIRSSVIQIIEKEPLLTLENIGYYCFYSKNKMLPSELRSEITNALVHKKSIPLLKEATESLKNNPTLNIFRCYTDTLDSHIKDVFIRIFREVGLNLSKNFIRVDQDIYFIERDKVPTPTMVIGILFDVNAMNSVRKVLGSRIAVESEQNEGIKAFHLSAVIPEFGVDFKKLKNVWKTKEWSLQKIILLLSWYSLQNKNSFYLNMLKYSSGLYSTRVKESYDDILKQIEKNIIFH